MLPFRPLVVVAGTSRAAAPATVLAHQCGDTVFAKASVPMMATWAAAQRAAGRGRKAVGRRERRIGRAGRPSL
jgi:hypothetical protein